MTRATGIHPHAIRPVGVEARPRPDARAERVFRAAVAHETLLARETARDLRFDPNDARWKLAIETSRRLQGAVLPFEDRRRLLAMATRLGIRSFDANLIVALVQDRARRGEPVEDAAPTIAMIPAAARDQARSAAREDDTSPTWAIVLLAAGAIDAALVAWLMLS